MNPCGEFLSPSHLRACTSQSLFIAGAVSKSEGERNADSVASWLVLGGVVDTSMISRPSSLLAGNCGGGSHSAIADENVVSCGLDSKILAYARLEPVTRFLRKSFWYCRVIVFSDIGWLHMPSLHLHCLESSLHLRPSISTKGRMLTPPREWCKLQKVEN